MDLTDTEIVRLCAEAMGYPIKIVVNKEFPSHEGCWTDCTMESFKVTSVMYPWEKKYDPLHDDAQCFALVKRFCLMLLPTPEGRWDVSIKGLGVANKDLNRGVCTLVAKMQKEKQCKT